MIAQIKNIIIDLSYDEINSFIQAIKANFKKEILNNAVIVDHEKWFDKFKQLIPLIRQYNSELQKQYNFTENMDYKGHAIHILQLNNSL